MDTPPGTTLSTPSPTDLQDRDPVAAEMEKSRMLKPIYLIVATTPCVVTNSTGAVVHRLGIGMNGKLPWPSIKADMKYFKDVTEGGMLDAGTSSEGQGPLNSVIMGRKTYFSIPAKFRPLRNRQNVVVTRGKAEGAMQATGNATASSTVPVMVAQSIIEAVHASSASDRGATFCIGGSEIYNAFLKDQELRPRLRILQTVIEKYVPDDSFECDTFWPEDLDDTLNRWQEVDTVKLTEWTGIALPQGQQEWHRDDKAEVRIRVRGWQQRSD